VLGVAARAVTLIIAGRAVRRMPDRRGLAAWTEDRLATGPR
jgi:hypothetical protein